MKDFEQSEVLIKNEIFINFKHRVNSTLHNEGCKIRNVSDHMYIARGEADSGIHVFWGIFFFYFPRVVFHWRPEKVSYVPIWAIPF